jgi:hypothetical protein
VEYILGCLVDEFSHDISNIILNQHIISVQCLDIKNVLLECRFWIFILIEVRKYFVFGSKHISSRETE